MEKKLYSVAFCNDGDIKVEKLFKTKDDAEIYLAKRYIEETDKAKDWCARINDMESFVAHPQENSVEFSGSWFCFHIDELDYPE